MVRIEELEPDMQATLIRALCNNFIPNPSLTSNLLKLFPELSKYIPFLNPMFDSFYAIIADINSFIKDLIR